MSKQGARQNRQAGGQKRRQSPSMWQNLRFKNLWMTSMAKLDYEMLSTMRWQKENIIAVQFKYPSLVEIKRVLDKIVPRNLRHELEDSFVYHMCQFIPFDTVQQLIEYSVCFHPFSEGVESSETYMHPPRINNECLLGYIRDVPYQHDIFERPVINGTQMCLTLVVILELLFCAGFVSQRGKGGYWRSNSIGFREILKVLLTHLDCPPLTHPVFKFQFMCVLDSLWNFEDSSPSLCTSLQLMLAGVTPPYAYPKPFTLKDLAVWDRRLEEIANSLSMGDCPPQYYCLKRNGRYRPKVIRTEIDARAFVFERLSYLAQHLFGTHVRTFLYGSAASGFATPRSDIDITVVLTEDDLKTIDNMRLEYEDAGLDFCPFPICSKLGFPPCLCTLPKERPNWYELVIRWAGRQFAWTVRRLLGWNVQCLEHTAVPLVRVYASMNSDGFPEPSSPFDTDDTQSPFFENWFRDNIKEYTESVLKPNLPANHPVVQFLSSDPKGNPPPPLPLGMSQSGSPFENFQKWFYNECETMYGGGISKASLETPPTEGVWSKFIDMSTFAGVLESRFDGDALSCDPFRTGDKVVNIGIATKIGQYMDITKENYDLSEYRKVWKIHVDVVFNHPLAVHNSRLLRSYAALDPRVHCLGLLVKEWTNNRKLNDARNGLLSGYQWMLTLIHYLQHLYCFQGKDPSTLWPFLPNLQEKSLIERVASVSEQSIEVEVHDSLQPDSPFDVAFADIDGPRINVSLDDPDSEWPESVYSVEASLAYAYACMRSPTPKKLSEQMRISRMKVVNLARDTSAFRPPKRPPSLSSMSFPFSSGSSSYLTGEDSPFDASSPEIYGKQHSPESESDRTGVSDDSEHNANSDGYSDSTVSPMLYSTLCTMIGVQTNADGEVPLPQEYLDPWKAYNDYPPRERVSLFALFMGFFHYYFYHFNVFTHMVDIARVPLKPKRKKSFFKFNEEEALWASRPSTVNPSRDVSLLGIPETQSLRVDGPKTLKYPSIGKGNGSHQYDQRWGLCIRDPLERLRVIGPYPSKYSMIAYEMYKGVQLLENTMAEYVSRNRSTNGSWSMFVTNKIYDFFNSKDQPAADLSGKSSELSLVSIAQSIVNGHVTDSVSSCILGIQSLVHAARVHESTKYLSMGTVNNLIEIAVYLEKVIMDRGRPRFNAKPRPLFSKDALLGDKFFSLRPHHYWMILSPEELSKFNELPADQVDIPKAEKPGTRGNPAKQTKQEDGGDQQF